MYIARQVQTIMSEKKFKTEVRIEPDQNGVAIFYESSILYKKVGSVFSCLLPGFDIAFTAKDEEEISIVGEELTKSFLDFWMHNYDLTKFSIELKKLGFSTNNDAVILNKIRNGVKGKAKFGSVININGNSYSNDIAYSGKIAA